MSSQSILPFGETIAQGTNIRGCDLLGPPGNDVGHQEAELAKLVMTYLARHPRAMDTVAGIVEWWMPEEAMGVDPQMMRRVLDKLTEQGRLERVGSGEHVHYRLKNH